MPLAICATPIGNLDDVTLRVLEELRTADVVLAEDTRHTRGLLARHGVEARLLSYHEHNEAARMAELVPRLLPGERIALVSDAGLPGISDPGVRLLRAARDAGAEVTVLPGPSSVETALVASGLAADRYAFVGFLPRRAAEREALWRELADWSWPTVAFESPKRLPATLRSLAAARPGADRGRVPRVDEAVRGDRLRGCRRARRTLRRAPERGGDARHRRLERRGRRDRRSEGRVRSGRRRHAATGRRRGRLPPDRTSRETTSIAALCDNFVTLFDNG